MRYGNRNPKKDRRAATWLLGLDLLLDVITASISLSQNAIMATFHKMLLDCIYYRQETTNGGVSAGSGDSSDRFSAIVYAALRTRAIKIHERRD